MKKTNSASLRDFGIGMLLGGGIAAVLIAAFYLMIMN